MSWDTIDHASQEPLTPNDLMGGGEKNHCFFVSWRYTSVFDLIFDYMQYHVILFIVL